MRASKPNSPRDEHLKDLFCVRSHCFPQQGAAGCTTSLLLAGPGDVQEAMVLLRDARLRIKQIIESCWKAQGYPVTLTRQLKTVEFRVFVPQFLSKFSVVELLWRRASWEIWSSSFLFFVNSIPLDISTASPSRLREWWSSQRHGAWDQTKIVLISPFYMVPVVRFTFLPKKSCQSLPSSSEIQQDTAPVAAFSTINF